MKNRKNTIRFRLHSTAVGVVLILIILGISIGYYINSVLKHNDVLQAIEHIYQQELELRKAEKDFLLYETTNSDYYKDRKSAFLDTINSKTDIITEKLIELRREPLVRSMEVSHQLNYLASYFRQYKGQMRELSRLIYEKGFKDYGYIGKMRNHIHQFEEMIRNKQNDRFMVYMLTLRRHEKDYLLRRDLKYKKKFTGVADRFLVYLETHKPEGHQLYISKIQSYHHFFTKIVELDLAIGLLGNEGILHDLNNTINKVEKTNNELKEVVFEHASEKIGEALVIIIMLTIALSGAIVVLLLRTTHYIIGSIAYLQRYITRLGKGELLEQIKTSKNDEIAEMTDSINVLSFNLKNTRDFAIEVGKGNLRTSINVFNNEGDIGGALIEMRNQLEKVAKEQKRSSTERENRAWVNEGLANFSELLRNHTESTEDLANEVLKNLLLYVDALQGAIYIVDDEAAEEVYELKASIAVNGRKVGKHNVYPGEDLLGRAVQLQKTIYLKKLPEDYMKVESALGYLPTQSLLILPLVTYNQVMGIVEVGSLRKFNDHVINFLERLAKELARAVLTVKANIKTKHLLKETQAQAFDLKERQHEILQQRSQLELVNENLQRERELTSQSIRYAQTIQNAILPSQNTFKRTFNESFLLFRPRDIVSGDFYWCSTISTADGRTKKAVAVIDCTGHGVPGAFMSLIGYSIMNQVIIESKVYNPADVLTHMNRRLAKVLKQNQDEGSNTDGMDLGLCFVEELSNNRIQVEYAGAKRPLFFIDSKQNEFSLIKGDRSPIGGGRRKHSPTFTKSEITLHKGSALYLTTDGFVDQNNLKRRKFGSLRLFDLLAKIGQKPMPEQEKILGQKLDEHSEGVDQRDDITLLGIRV